MPARKSIPPSPQEIGARIVRNLDRARGFLTVLQNEIQDPSKSGHAGKREEWQMHSEKLDASLVQLRGIINQADLGNDS